MQLGLFGFVRPKKKVPISAERIREVQELIRKRDGKNAAIRLRDLREGLERFERTL